MKSLPFASSSVDRNHPWMNLYTVQHLEFADLMDVAAANFATGDKQSDTVVKKRYRFRCRAGYVNIDTAQFTFGKPNRRCGTFT
jgi:hypothetical protein